MNIVYLTFDFDPVEEDKADMAKITPDTEGAPPFFVMLRKDDNDRQNHIT